MYKNMNKRISIIVALVIVLVGALAYQNKVHKQANEPIKIGGLFALSGYAAFAGEASRDGFLMAIEDSGTKIPYVIEDFHSDVKTALTAAKKLTEVDKVQMVIGPEWSEFGEVVAPLAKEKNIPFISPWMNSEPAWVNPYYFSATPSGRGQYKKILDYMERHGVKNIVIVYSNNAWSLGERIVFSEEVKTNGKINVLGEFKSGQDAKDFRNDIIKINQIKPDAIYSIFSTWENQGLFSKQLSNLGFFYPIYSQDSLAEDPSLKEQFGKYVVGQIYTKITESKNSPAFVNKFEKRFGHKPGAISAAAAYDMTALTLDAIKNGAKNGKDIQKYLSTVKNYDGYSNSITFNQKGQVEGSGFAIKKITVGGYEMIEN